MRASAQSLFVSQKQKTFINRENAEDLIVLAGLIEEGRLSPVVDRSFPLSEAPQAIRYVEGGRARGKVVVDVTADGPR